MRQFLMDSSASTLILHRPPLVFDTSHLEKQPNLPSQFLWPHEDAQDELKDPPIDLKGFFNGDQQATDCAAAQVRAACSKHGFFQVINHGVDPSVIQAAHDKMDAFFKLPVSKKLSARRKPGQLCGYSGAHADRFLSKLPWKETFSFTYKHVVDDDDDEPGHDVVSYIVSNLGQDFEEDGYVYQRYCESMKKLSLGILELLAVSLGVKRLLYREFFEDGISIMRGNNYPACREAGLTLGTGPHSDPNSLTILHQDQVGGLQIFSDNKWQAITPRPDAFVVNIGDTFMALCNGRYKSCLHRAVVNKEKVRRSLVFFVNPKEDKIVRPPNNIDDNDEDEQASNLRSRREYPDFTWSDLREFTQNHYRADTATLQNFLHWLTLEQHK